VKTYISINDIPISKLAGVRHHTDLDYKSLNTFSVQYFSIDVALWVRLQGSKCHVNVTSFQRLLWAGAKFPPWPSPGTSSLMRSGGFGRL
jgi:hypothetical protein